MNVQTHTHTHIYIYIYIQTACHDETRMSSSTIVELEECFRLFKVLLTFIDIRPTIYYCSIFLIGCAMYNDVENGSTKEI